MFEILAKHSLDALAEIVGDRATSPARRNAGPGILLTEEIGRRSAADLYTEWVLVTSFADPVHADTVIRLWHRILLVDLPQRCGTSMVH